MAILKKARGTTAATLFAVATLTACGGPKAVRGEEVAGLDQEAMGTGLDQTRPPEDAPRQHERLAGLRGDPALAE